MSYFLPDWDDLLDEHFDFDSDGFSGVSRQERGDKHCCLLMKPKRMSDGVLVSLAQHVTSKGPLRRIMGSEANSLAPINLRNQFGLGGDQSLFGDCGAFSYVNEDSPTISVEQAVALYQLHGFDFGASVDHIPVRTIINDGVKHDLAINAERGWVIDYGDIKEAFAPIHDALDHRYLNEVEGLENPTSENLCCWIWNRLQQTLPGLSQVVVHETCTSGCIYDGEARS
jgi:hypothetical protein